MRIIYSVLRRSWWACLLLLAAGCQPPVEMRTYDVNVLNRLQEPITVFLTKSGPPDERGWLTPEQLASLPISNDTGRSGKVIRPLETLHIHNAVGYFYPEVSGVLRVYRQVGTLEDFSALSFGNPKRLDVYLRPGFNNLLIYGDDSGLVVQRDNP